MIKLDCLVVCAPDSLVRGREILTFNTINWEAVRFVHHRTAVMESLGEAYIQQWTGVCWTVSGEITMSSIIGSVSV